MHNGVYNTLEEVMDFYNKGGGAGMGFDLEHQTLPFDELNLTDEEQKALVAFVKTLSDTNVSSTGEVKYELASSAE
jgi:cytochrome c peroxidase